MLSASRSSRSLICLLVLGMLFFSTPQATQACSPSSPDPWFTEQISIPAVDLPNGIGIHAIQITRYGNTRDYVEITNRSDTPLYIIGTFWTAEKTVASLPVSLPSGVAPTHKLVNQQAYSWRPIFDTPQSHAHMGWEQDTIERRDAILLSIDYNTLMSDQGNVVALAPLNQTGDNRPENILLPAPQTVQLPLVYGTQILHAPITISYMLNSNYQADSVARSFNACGSSRLFLPSLFLATIVVGGCGALGWIGIRRWRIRHTRN